MIASIHHSFTSPLRYPGGKGALANFIKMVVSQNGLLDGQYVELYAGGAGVAWPLLFEEYVQRVYINDLNQAVYAFWHAVLTTPDDLCRLIRDASITIEEWHRQRAIQEQSNRHTPLEVGFSTFFLNRTNHSGIIRGGVIGGKSQTGKLGLDARFNKEDLIARIMRIARYAKRISLYNLDAAEFIAQVLPTLPKRALVYLDPPYYGKGSDLYENHYTHDDHVNLANLLLDWSGQPWIVSYDASPAILALYHKYRSLRYNISYSAQARYSGSEVMFFSPELVIPRVADPTRVR